MAKGKKLKEIAPTIIRCEPFTAEEQETRFKKDYEFNKQTSARSPVSGWEHKYIMDGSSSAPPKEQSLVKGTAHTYRGMRTNNSYGKRQAVKRIKG